MTICKVGWRDDYNLLIILQPTLIREMYMQNHSFDIYKKISWLFAKGIHIYDILFYLGIKRVYIYGIGRMGNIILSDLSGNISIPITIDQKAREKSSIQIQKKSRENGKWENYCYPVVLPSEIPDDLVPILITPASSYYDIVALLRKQGVSEKRFLPLNLLLYYGIYFQSELLQGNKCFCSKIRNFLITGGQFSNKGSQSMVYVAVDEIKNRYPDALVWFFPNFWDDEYIYGEKYNMIFLLDGSGTDSTLYELLPQLDGIVDVSGYALGSNWSKDVIDRYVRILSMARDYNVPIYLMPQSFGPFDFDINLKRELGELLSYAKIIYAREKSGYEMLLNTFALSNVVLSKDIVLQNKRIDWKQIYAENRYSQNCLIETDNNVAIVPNKQNYRYTSSGELLRLYQIIIEHLLHMGKNIYIISHSEDQDLCKNIYQMFQGEDKVYLYNKSFDCIGFSELVRNFQYLIASRFHAIVHAYKEGVPCVVIGWAEKYIELLEMFYQEKYLFDVRKQIDYQEVQFTLEQMERLHTEESSKIISVLPEIQKQNCFNILNETETTN